MDNVKQFIPHRPPFLFVDEILSATEESLTAQRRIRADDVDAPRQFAHFSDARFRQIIRPGDVLTIEVRLKERMGKFFFMHGRVTSDGRRVMTVDFGVAMEAGNEEGASGSAG